MRGAVVICAAVAAGSLLFTGTHRGRPDPGKLDRALAGAIREHRPTLRVLVQTRRDALQRVAGVLSASGHPARQTFASIGAIAADIDAATLSRLTGDAGVLRVSSDAVVRSAAVTWSSSAPLVSDNRLVRSLGMENWAPTGSGVVVAVIDSGVVANSDFTAAAKFDFTGRAKPKSVSGGDLHADEYGHGSHVASLIGLRGSSNPSTYRGVAPSASVLSLRVLDENGAGYTSDVIAAIDYCVTNKAKLKIDIINLSLGHPIYEPAATDPLVQAVERASRAGIAVIVAAGNYGINPYTGRIGFAGITSPGNAPSAITVGAVDAHGTQTLLDDTIAPYSSRGPSWYDGFAKPDVVVSGHRLVGLVGDGTYLATNYPASVTRLPGAGHNFMTLSGTSMAAGVASGVAAEFLRTVRLATGVKTLTFDGKLPSAMQSTIQGLCTKYGVSDCSPYLRGLTPAFLKAVLQYTAIPVNGAHVLEQGAGELNPLGAFELAKHFTTADLERRFVTGDLSLGGEIALGIPQHTRIGGETLDWSQQLIWGDRVIPGSTAMYNDPAWGLAVVWGNAVVWGDRFTWGDNTSSVVWRDAVVWGSAVVWADRVLTNGNHQTGLNGTAVVWGSSLQDVNDPDPQWGNLQSLSLVQRLSTLAPGTPDSPYTSADPY